MPIRILATLILITLAAGCSYTDGIYGYTASGRLIDDAGKPVGGRAFVVREWPLESATPFESEILRTSSDGRFTYAFGGQRWGYQSLFGVIPLNTTNPKPPLLKEVYLAVEQAPGEWAQKDIRLTKRQQPERGQVVLGDVTVP